MKNLSSFPYSLFLSSKTSWAALRGSFFLILLFAFCFFCIHLVKFALLGWKTRNPTPPAPTPEKEKAPPTPPEPVYYIVERKQRRAKANYGEPKQIHFK